MQKAVLRKVVRQIVVNKGIVELRYFTSEQDELFDLTNCENEKPVFDPTRDSNDSGVAYSRPLVRATSNSVDALATNSNHSRGRRVCGDEIGEEIFVSRDWWEGGGADEIGDESSSDRGSN